MAIKPQKKNMGCKEPRFGGRLGVGTVTPKLMSREIKFGPYLLPQVVLARGSAAKPTLNYIDAVVT